MKTNRLKQDLAAGKTVIGTFCLIPSHSCEACKTVPVA